MIELIGMQHKRNSNRKIYGEVLQFCSYQGGDFGDDILLPVCLILSMPIAQVLFTTVLFFYV